ncbi:YEATS domain-containing protein 2 [Drosophila persimilis]|uniref:YEATS domain-containing protein 2 n=1 Tax=Drosophila persimilis TaxID=7234 RepID=UPI000F077EF8|nr:YEATS domain-containing protein 2 [Drosophila persimilis]
MEQSAPATPKKRKHSEYHDPDYLQTASTNEDSEDAATNQQKRTKLETESAAEEEEEELDKSAQPQRVPVPDTTEKVERICEIVRVEFQREISLKDEQLAEIDRRLLQARQLLDKLRFEVVSEYYRKQQVPLGESLFSDESAGPQLPLHPAIKKIVGKRPLLIQNHLPERTAATLAKQTIRQRNPAHRRAERRRQQKIREQGIVIDHSKDQQQQSINIKVEDEQPCTSRQAHERQQQQQLELNSSRLNNKNKFNFVVGNTSKYIGGDGKTTLENGGQALVYKWLVYVQGKDLPKPLETYIKKVRFQLHHSYRPNDIVDVHAPPFQLNRRGWGEFPMRIQLFFHEHLRQKPVQLMHTVVLDKTISFCSCSSSLPTPH